MIRVVFDTNVIVSANLNDQGIEALIVALALNRKLRLYVSAPILEEYERVLHYPRLQFAPDEVVAFLARLRRTSTTVKPLNKVTAAKHEPDNRFLECAEASRADYLITGNKRHFPKAWKNTTVLNAREFLAAVGPGLLG